MSAENVPVPDIPQTPVPGDAARESLPPELKALPDAPPAPKFDDARPTPEPLEFLKYKDQQRPKPVDAVVVRPEALAARNRFPRLRRMARTILGRPNYSPSDAYREYPKSEKGPRNPLGDQESELIEPQRDIMLAMKEKASKASIDLASRNRRDRKAQTGQPLFSRAEEAEVKKDYKRSPLRRLARAADYLIGVGHDTPALLDTYMDEYIDIQVGLDHAATEGDTSVHAGGIGYIADGYTEMSALGPDAEQADVYTVDKRAILQDYKRELINLFHKIGATERPQAGAAIDTTERQKYMVNQIATWLDKSTPRHLSEPKPLSDPTELAYTAQVLLQTVGIRSQVAHTYKWDESSGTMEHHPTNLVQIGDEKKLYDAQEKAFHDLPEDFSFTPEPEEGDYTAPEVIPTHIRRDFAFQTPEGVAHYMLDQDLTSWRVQPTSVNQLSDRHAHVA